MQSTETTEQVYSNLADDPDLADQVDRFVASLPRILTTLREYADLRDWSVLKRAAHRLAGSSGCYGFDEVAVQARRLEAACRQGRPEQVVPATFAELERLCSRVRSRRPK